MSSILIVDDEPDIRAVARLMLESDGFDVHEARSGEEGLELLDDPPSPDVVLLDIRMPGIDGWEVLRRLRESGHVDNPPVVVFSAHAKLAEEEKFAASGAQYLVTKPFRKAELIATIKSAMTANGHPATPESAQPEDDAAIA